MLAVNVDGISRAGGKGVGSLPAILVMSASLRMTLRWGFKVLDVMGIIW